MYKIIGGDQKEYGPVSFDQLCQWVRDNRANAQTRVQKEGGEWAPMGALPEFAEVLGEQAQQARLRESREVSAPGMAGGSAMGSGPAMAPVPLPAFGGGLDGREQVRAMVRGPATALLVTGILCVVLALIGLVANMFGSGFQPSPEDVPPEMRQMFEMLSQMQGPMAVVSSLIGLAISGLMIYAAQKMQALESFGLVVAAAVLGMVPCTSPCCCIGLPVGIWVLVVLFKPEVKSMFQ
ncbi:MAG: DUF4339 domain-containing protein [Verrucomicrobiae bacterium]|nr:DUF4339 domain-containing protein [Verrucomicrobiae bacterium]